MRLISFYGTSFKSLILLSMLILAVMQRSAAFLHCHSSTFCQPTIRSPKLPTNTCRVRWAVTTPKFTTTKRRSSSNIDDDAEEDSKQSRGSLLKDIMRFRGPVETGYGRGGKQLGVPTANLGPASVFREALQDVAAGVYFGWALLEDNSNDTAVSMNDSTQTKQRQGRNVIHKAVVNVGYSPTFEGKENAQKIIEAHLIFPKDSDQDDNDDKLDEMGGSTENHHNVLNPTDFYGETMRLQLDGFLRPEQKFPSFPDLIAQIHADVQDANSLLDTSPYETTLKQDAFLQEATSTGSSGSSTCWIGKSGGDKVSSWEFEPMVTIV